MYLTCLKRWICISPYFFISSFTKNPSNCPINPCQHENTAQIFSSIAPSGSFLWVISYFGLRHQLPPDKMHHAEHWPNYCWKDMATAHQISQVLKSVQRNKQNKPSTPSFFGWRFQSLEPLCSFRKQWPLSEMSPSFTITSDNTSY